MQDEKKEKDLSAALLPVDPSAPVETKALPTCGDCRYQVRDEHGGGWNDCALRAENDTERRYRFGWDKRCSVFDDRGFPEFKPSAEVMDKIVDDLRAQLKRIGSGNQITPTHSDATRRSEAQ